MESTAALAVLQDALNRCRGEDMRTPEVFAALDFLAAGAHPQWPFKEFREALDSEEAEERWQVLNASLNGIKLAIRKN